MPHKQFLPRMKYSNHPTQSQVRARAESGSPKVKWDGTSQCCRIDTSIQIYPETL